MEPIKKSNLRAGPLFWQQISLQGHEPKKESYIF